MNKSFLFITAVLNIICAFIFVLSDLIFSTEEVFNLSSGLVGAILILTFVAFFIARIFNTIYFFKDGYVLASYLNIFLMACFFLISINPFLFSAGIYNNEFYILSDSMISKANLFVGIIFNLVLLITAKTKHTWLKTFAVISICSILISANHQYNISPAGSKIDEFTSNYKLDTVTSVLSLISLSIHLLKRRKLNDSIDKASKTNQEVVDNFSS